MDREPVLIFLAGLAAVVDAGLIASTGLDWLPWDGGQCASVVAFVTAACALAAAVLRSIAFSPATVARLSGAANKVTPSP